MINFGQLFRRAWDICWGNRWLFLLGMLAALGGTGGGFNSTVNYSFGEADVGPQFEQQMEEFLRTLLAAWPYLLAGAFALFLVALILWLLSLAARGGLIAAAAELDGEPGATPGTAVGFGQALRRGAAFLPRLVGLDLLLYGPILLLIGIPVAVLVASIASAGIAALEEPGALGGILLIAVTCLCLLGCLALLWQLFLAFLHPLAQRSLVLDRYGVVAAIRHGWRVLAGHAADVLLLVLFLFVIGLIVNALIAAVLIPLGLLLAVPTIFDLMQGSLPSGQRLLTIAIGALLLGLLGQLLRGLFLTYQSVAYTLAYRRFTGKSVTEAEPAPEPKPATPYQFEEPGQE